MKTAITRRPRWYYRTESGRTLQGDVPAGWISAYSDLGEDLDLAVSMTRLPTVSSSRFAVSAYPLLDDIRQRPAIPPEQVNRYMGRHVCQFTDDESALPIVEICVLFAGADEDPDLELLRPIDDIMGVQTDNYHTTWGYGGTGPHQTALTILAHALGERLPERQLTSDEYRASDAVWLHGEFVAEMIGRLPQDADFTLSGAFVQGWIATKKGTLAYQERLAEQEEDARLAAEIAALEEAEESAEDEG